MIVIVPDAGLLPLLARITQGPDGYVYYRLFTNNVTITRATVFGDLVEAAWSGYAFVPLTATDFTIQVVSGHQGTFIAPPFSWGNSSGGDQTAYGYFVTNVGNTQLLWAANFDNMPATIPDGGGLLTVPIIGDMWST